MSPKESRVVKISVRKEVYDRLREFAESKGLTMSDAIAVLLDNATISSMIKELHATLSSKLDELHATIGSMVSSSADGSTTSQSAQPAPPHLAIPPTMARVDDAKKGRRKEKVVKWVRGIRDPDKYFDVVSKKEGRPVLWNEVGEGRICYAFEDEVASLVDELNSVGAILDDVTKTDKYLDAKELYQCNLIYFDIVERKWKVLS